MTPSRDSALAWMADGTEMCERAIGGLSDVELAEPSALPGWSRAHVIAHVDGNARALGNLVSWAHTGIETPMYASSSQRNADIEAGAALPPAELRARFAESCAALAAGLDALPPDRWAAEVRTAQGRMIPASSIPWLRTREVMIHACDLGAGIEFDQLPDGFLSSLIDDIIERRAGMDAHPAITVVVDGRTWQVLGEGEPAIVSGTLAQAAAYLAGRGSLGPDIPAWL